MDKRSALCGTIENPVMTKQTKYRTPQELISALEKSAQQKLSAEEIQEQRVSFVYGSMDADSSVSKIQVRRILSNSVALSA